VKRKRPTRTPDHVKQRNARERLEILRRNFDLALFTLALRIEATLKEIANERTNQEG
jgi:hypothetical protein